MNFENLKLRLLYGKALLSRMLIFSIILLSTEGKGQYSNYEFLLASKVLSIETKVYVTDKSNRKLEVVNKGGGFHSEKVIFNSTGNVTEIYRYKTDRYEIFKSFSFRQDKLTETRKYRDGILHSRESTEYNNNGRIERYEKVVKGEVWESNTYQYYSDGFKTVCTKPKYDLKHEVVSYTNEQGNILKTIDNELFLPEEILYQYDRQDRLLSKVGRGLGSYYKYLANGEYVIDKYLNDILQNSKRYNANHQLLKSKNMDSQGDLESTYTVAYDKNGYEIAHTWESDDRPLSTTSLDYKLDSKSNVIEIKYYDEHTKKGFLVTRELKYN